VLAGVSHQRQKVWHDRPSLWQDTLDKNPLSDTAANNLAFAWFDQGEYKQAIETWKKTLMMTKGRKADAWAGLAIGFEAIGNEKMANQAYTKAIGTDRRYKSPDLLMKSAGWDHTQLNYLRQISERLTH
jgi:tetratricopeptide (TPR) repeat protein